MTPAVRRAATAYYPFELSNELRADVVAHSYYKDPTMDWMIYLVNGITDPYYDWYLYPEEFNAFIIKKYGSIEASIETVSHYQTNWATDPINITTGRFQSIPEQIQKYYIPIFGAKGKILSYTRRKEDWVANTNKIVQLTLSNSSSFNVGEIVELSSNCGKGTVVYISATTISLQHVSGTVAGYNIADASVVIGKTVTGETSGTTGTITARIVLTETISDDEYVFWEPVTYYDKETNLNESKRYVYLLDQNLAPKITEEIRKSLIRK